MSEEKEVPKDEVRRVKRKGHAANRPKLPFIIELEFPVQYTENNLVEEVTVSESLTAENMADFGSAESEGEAMILIVKHMIGESRAFVKKIDAVDLGRIKDEMAPFLPNGLDLSTN